MIYFLYGPDTYRLNLKLKEIIGQYKEKHGNLDFFNIDLEDNPDGWAEVREFLGQFSIFSSPKLAVIRNISFMNEAAGISDDDAKAFSIFLESFSDNKEIFVVITDLSRPVAGFGFLLESKVKSQEFGELARERLEFFVKTEAAKVGVAFDDQALGFLTEYIQKFPDRSWRALGEIQRLSCYRTSGNIDLMAIRELVSWVRTDESFRLATVMLRSEANKKLAYLEALRFRGDEPRYTLNLLNSLARDRKDVAILADLDEKIKSGILDDETALTAFVLRS